MLKLLFYGIIMLSVNYDYILTAREEPIPQLLQVSYEGRLYHLLIHYLSLDFQHPECTWHRFSHHSHDVFHSVLYLSGSNRISLLDENPPIRRGSLILTSPGEPHSFSTVTKSSFSYQEFMFTMESGSHVLPISFQRLLEIYTGQNLSNVKFPVDLTEAEIAIHDALLQDLLTGLSGEAPLAPILRTTAILKLFRFYIEVVYCPRLARPLSEAYPGLVRAKERLERHYHNEIHLPDLAKLAGMSTAHFCRRFKAAFGQTPIQHLIQTRIQAAKTLLKTTSLSCKEVGICCGFSDPIFFNRIFKREANATPGFYRKSSP